MKNALAFVTAAALTASPPAAQGTAEARDHWGPEISAGLATAAPDRGTDANGYRCSDGPVYNFYDGADFGGRAPAVYLGYAYRPYYRYMAYRVIPRTYACHGYWRP